jgi:hypothetical protein
MTQAFTDIGERGKRRRTWRKGRADGVTSGERC